MRFFSNKILFSLFLVIGVFGFVEISSAVSGCCLYYTSSSDPNRCVLYKIDKVTGNFDNVPGDFQCAASFLQDSNGFYIVSLEDQSKFYLNVTNYKYYLEAESYLGSYNLNEIVESCPVVNDTVVQTVPSSDQHCIIGLGDTGVMKYTKFTDELNPVIQNYVKENFDRLYTSKFVPSLSKLCCVPESKEVNGMCQLPSWNQPNLREALLGEKTDYGIWNDFRVFPDLNDVSTLLDCPEKHDLYPVACNSVAHVTPPPEYVSDGSSNLAFTLSSYCSIRQNTRFCACKKDMSSCVSGRGVALKTDCELTIDSTGICAPVDGGKDCTTLVQSTNSNQTAATNSDLLGGLRSDIENLNRLQINNVQDLIGRVIKTILGILGSIALAMIMYGGFVFMTSNGNADKRKSAVGILVWSTLGVTIIFSSYVIVNFVLEILK